MKNFIICGYAPYNLYQIKLERIDKKDIFNSLEGLPHSCGNPCIIVMSDSEWIEYRDAHTLPPSYRLYNKNDEIIFEFPEDMINRAEHEEDKEEYEKLILSECIYAEKTIINKIKENGNLL